MSFMPNVGTVVRMQDDRIAIVASFSPLGDNDTVMFEDGHIEATDAWQISELLSDEDEASPADLLGTLKEYVHEGSPS